MEDHPDFSHILTPELYSRFLKVHFPWEGPVDMKFASKFYFLDEPDNSREVYDASHLNALKPISTVTPSIPSLRKYLPDPNDPKFPLQALALVLLLDQAPRTLYRGMDIRYTYMFFDVTSRKLVKDLISSGIFPDEIDQWTALGFPFEDAMVRKFWLYGPLIHSEELADHDFMKDKIENMRKDVERYSGVKDPWRDTKEKDSKDTTLFSRLYRGGPPETFVDFFFWLFRVFDAHRPIIEKFGKYPYRNNAQGRETSEDEKKFLDQTRNFGAPPLTDREIETLREEIEKGIWEKLSDRGPW